MLKRKKKEQGKNNNNCVSSFRGERGCDGELAELAADGRWQRSVFCCSCCVRERAGEERGEGGREGERGVSVRESERAKRCVSVSSSFVCRKQKASER